MRHAIAVVGGGITGLALHHFLRKAGADSVVLEAAERPGGVIRSRRVEGRVLDLGPQRTRLVPAVEGLVEELGLREEVLTAEPGLPLFVWREGALREVPRTWGELLETDLLSRAGKARLLCEPLTAAPRGGETVDECLSRKLGRQAYRRMLGPLFGGIYGSDPGRMYVRHSLTGLLEAFGVRRSFLGAFLRRWRTGRRAPPACTFREGMQRLPEALWERHRLRVHLGASVKTLRRRNGRWELDTARGAVESKAVVLTVPAAAAAGILAEAAPPASARLARLRYNPLAVVHLESDCPIRGYGYQAAFGEELETLGVTWNASLFAGREPTRENVREATGEAIREGTREGIYTAYLGGMRDPDIASRPDGEIGATAAREFREVTGCPARVLLVSRTGVPAYDFSWTALDGWTAAERRSAPDEPAGLHARSAPAEPELPPGLRLCASYLSRPGISGRLLAARELAGRLAGGACVG